LAKHKSPTYQPSQVEQTYGVLGQCINESRMPYAKVIGALRTFVDEHPEEFTNDMAVVVFRAVTELCRERSG
jgi:nitrate reductase assembly molybdenum cofactor insertion protein NarJ